MKNNTAKFTVLEERSVKDALPDPGQTLLEAQLEPDPCYRKHGGNEESVRANLRNLTYSRNQDRKAVYEIIAAAGREGISMKQVAKRMGKDFSSVSGRGTELKRDDLIEKTGHLDNDGSAKLRVCSPWSAPIPSAIPQECPLNAFAGDSSPAQPLDDPPQDTLEAKQAQEDNFLSMFPKAPEPVEVRSVEAAMAYLASPLKKTEATNG